MESLSGLITIVVMTLCRRTVTEAAPRQGALGPRPYFCSVLSHDCTECLFLECCCRFQREVYERWEAGVNDACSFNMSQQLLFRDEHTRLISVNFDPQASNFTTALFIATLAKGILPLIESKTRTLSTSLTYTSFVPAVCVGIQYGFSFAFDAYLYLHEKKRKASQSMK